MLSHNAFDTRFRIKKTFLFSILYSWFLPFIEFQFQFQIQSIQQQKGYLIVNVIKWLIVQARIHEKKFPISRFYQMFTRFFTNKIFQGSQVRTLRQSESAPDRSAQERRVLRSDVMKTANECSSFCLTVRDIYSQHSNFLTTIPSCEHKWHKMWCLVEYYLFFFTQPLLFFFELFSYHSI